MATDSACSECGSLDVIPDAVLQPDGHGGKVLVWKGNRHASLTVRVCGACGHAEFFVANPETLLPAAKKP